MYSHNWEMSRTLNSMSRKGSSRPPQSPFISLARYWGKIWFIMCKVANTDFGHASLPGQRQPRRVREGDGKWVTSSGVPFAPPPCSLSGLSLPLSVISSYFLQSSPIFYRDHNRRHISHERKDCKRRINWINFLKKLKKMSERYCTIGVPMTDLPRPTTSVQHRIEV